MRVVSAAQYDRAPAQAFDDLLPAARLGSGFFPNFEPNAGRSVFNNFQIESINGLASLKMSTRDSTSSSSEGKSQEGPLPARDSAMRYTQSDTLNKVIIDCWKRYEDADKRIKETGIEHLREDPRVLDKLHSERKYWFGVYDHNRVQGEAFDMKRRHLAPISLTLEECNAFHEEFVKHHSAGFFNYHGSICRVQYEEFADDY